MLSALGFLTVVGGGRAPDARTLRWFPLAGTLIGGALALVMVGARELWPMAVVAAIVVVADLALTGMLHVDGLADTADGLLPHLDRDRRLEVMRAPDVGAFALAVVPAVMLLRWATLATDRIEPLDLVWVWGVSRTIMATIPALVSYARPTGLATSFLAGAHPVLAVFLVVYTIPLADDHGVRGILAVVAGVAAAGLLVLLAHRRLGGYTGDVLGAAGVLAETTALLVLAANP